jgi:inosine-uridine nucleoside N-ribohydrolase
VTTVSGRAFYRAKVTAGLLAAAGRDDIPIAVGIDGGDGVHPGTPQSSLATSTWRDDFGDGVDALVAACAEPVTIIALGPLTNLAAALERDPSIASRARVVAMLGSVRKGYKGSVEPVPEYNVKVDVDACRAVLAAPWEVTITPVDTCGTIYLRDADYLRVLAATNDPLVGAVVMTHREWLMVNDALELFERRTTTLYDTVAIHLAHDESLVEIEELPIAVDDDGLMRVEDGAPIVRVATRWRDERAFLHHLTERLTLSELGPYER